MPSRAFISIFHNRSTASIVPVFRDINLEMTFLTAPTVPDFEEIKSVNDFPIPV